MPGEGHTYSFVYMKQKKIIIETENNEISLVVDVPFK